MLHIFKGLRTATNLNALQIDSNLLDLAQAAAQQRLPDTLYAIWSH